MGINDLYFKWYENEKVKKVICDSLYNREMMLIDKVNPENIIRSLKCHEPKYFDSIFNLFRVKDRGILYNIYYSLAKYKNGIPVRNTPESDTWKENHHKFMVSYDFVIDIDGYPQHFKKVWEDTKRILDDMDKDNIKYIIRFSGQGFHIYPELNYGFIPFDPTVENNIYHYHYALARKYYDKISELVDMSIYDDRRVIKCPYSLAVYPNINKIYVCSPLTRDEFNVFLENKDDYELTENNFDKLLMRLK